MHAKLRTLLILLPALSLAACSGGHINPKDSSGLPPPSQPVNADSPERLAVKGYDVVSYFNAAAPAKGLPQHEAVHDGIRYRFATGVNLAAFQLNPARYTPAYGGYCATAMADGNRVDIDPETYRITDGRLYLFFNFVINARNAWDDNPAELKARADKHWAEEFVKTKAAS